MKSTCIVSLVAGMILPILVVGTLSAAWEIEFPETTTEICDHCPVVANGTGDGTDCDLTLRVYVQSLLENEGTGHNEGMSMEWDGTVNYPAAGWPVPSQGQLKIWKDDNDDEQTAALDSQEFFLVES